MTPGHSVLMMKIMRLLIGFCFLMSLTTHAETPPNKKIVLLGDSITEGYGVSHEEAYPTLIQNRALKEGKHWLIINSGLSGSTSASAPSRMIWTLKQKPDLVVLALGGNDGLRGSPVKNMEENLIKAIELAKKEKVKVILAGMKLPPNFGAEYTRDFSAAFPQIAKKENVPFIPFLLENVAGQTELNQPDGIHPNAKGHARVAETVYEAIRKNL